MKVFSGPDDARVTYILGFYPDEKSWDGTSHQLKVMVNRPGVEVRARRSYFAGDPPAESELAREAALQMASASALSGTAIGVTVDVPSNPLKQGHQQIDVSVDPHDVRFEEKGGKWHADFDLVLVQKAADGRTLQGERSRCVLDRWSYAESQSAGLSFHREIAILEKASILQVLVQDSVNGAGGSLAVPVEFKGKSKR